MSKWLLIALLTGLLPAVAAAGTQTDAPPDTSGLISIDPSTYGASVEQIMAGPGDDEAKIAALQRLLVTDPRNVAAYNNLGVLHARRGEWPQARDAFLSAVQVDPRLPEPHRNLGLAFLNVGQGELAVRELEAYARLAGPEGRDAWRLLGDALRRSGDLAGARRRLEHGLEVLGEPFDGEKARTVMMLVKVLEEAGEETAVEETLARYAPAARRFLQEAGAVADPSLADGDPGLKAARVIVNRLVALKVENARLLAESGMTEQAADLYRQALELAPEHDELIPAAVATLLDAGRSMDAEILARRAVKEHPEHAGGWEALGRIAEADGRLRDAIDHYVKAWRLDRGDMTLAGRVAQLYLQIGDNDGAQRFLADVVSSPDAPAEMLLNYALSLQRQGHYRLSLPTLRRAVRARPDLLSAWQAMAQALRKTRQWDKAADAYARCLELKQDAKFAFQRGYCLYRLERYDEAATAFRRAIELDPEYDKAYSNLGLALLGAGRDQEALEAFEKALAFQPDSYKLMLNKGICLYRLGRYEDALLTFEAAMERQETPAVWNNLGLVYDALGEKAEAQRCYKEAKRLRAAEGGNG